MTAKTFDTRYNLCWTKHGETDRSAVPLGNGELGASVWVSKNGDLQFYLARTDAYTENDRNVKLGKVCVSFHPNPFLEKMDFKQQLLIQDGCLCIDAGEQGKQIHLKLFIDKEEDILYIRGMSDVPVDMTVHYTNWRTQEPHRGDMVETTDVIENFNDGILFYHQNGETVVRKTAELQCLGEFIDDIYDTLKDRTFGGMIKIDGAKAESNTIKLNQSKEFTVKIATMSEQLANICEWKEKLKRLANDAETAQEAERRTKRWWNEYWDTSWIYVEKDKPEQGVYGENTLEWAKEPMEDNECCPSAITMAYIHTKYMFACCSSGEFLIQFNGALFNLMPGGGKHIDLQRFGETLTTQPDGEPTAEINPDERAWGHCILWQNHRLPYYSMLARGEHENLKRLFKFYRRFWNINRHKAKVFYNGEGQYNNEIITTFGLMGMGAYGYDRTDKPITYTDSQSCGPVDYSPGFELIMLMFDYYDYMQDIEFLKDEILPFAKDLLLSIETRFKTRIDGRIFIDSLHCVETFRDVPNPLTVVAGMHAVLERILALDCIGEEKQYFSAYSKIAPEIPVETVNGKRRYAPAYQYDKPKNCEPVWLNPVFPYKLTTRFKGDYELGYHAYEYCQKERENIFRPYALGSYPTFTSYSGWQYAGMAAALLGLSEDAAEVLAHNCAQKNPGHKYPAMFGPCYDSVPDVDHAANIMNTLQYMLLQNVEDKLYLFPAWKKEWNVSFKLHAPKDTIIICEFAEGEVKKLEVYPKSREKDIVLCLGDAR